MALPSPRRLKALALVAAGYVVHELLEIAGVELFDHLALLLMGGWPH